jgi:hypothetical protein
VSPHKPFATIAAVALMFAACSSRPAPGVAPAASGDSSGSPPKGTHRLESVDGRPLPASVRVPRDSMPGVATPPGMDVVAGVLWFPTSGGAMLQLRVRLLDCGPAVSTPNATGTADCRPTPQEPTVGGAVPFTHEAGRITVRWPTGRSGSAEVAEGTVRGDTITLDLPFRRVYGPGRRDATWTQRFIFVRLPSDRRPASPNDSPKGDSP